MSLKNILSFSNLTLLVALSLSTVAAYYSIIGLTAIFAGAVIPIIIMGSILEVGKITTTVWLRKYWDRASLTLKFYLVPAVILLAFLTSMGIFGFLSKAHTDQNLVSGDVVAKVSLLDEKIKTQRDNIELARKALAQLDAQVDQRLARGDSEQGAERAVQIRRQQQSERAKLQKEIGDAQKEITKLNEERAPIAAEVRKVEAEVGPIKYIAAFIYGDNPDANLLEAAVRWVIILIVIVFDPLAIALVLAANASKEWDKETEESDKPDSWVADVGEKPTENELKEIEDFVDTAAEETFNKVNKNDPHQVGWMFTDHGEHPKDKLEYLVEEVPEKSILEQHPYLTKGDFWKKPEGWVEVGPLVAKVEEPVTPTEVKRPEQKTETIITEGVTKENPLKDLNDGYALYEGKHFSMVALKEMHPELFITADSSRQIKTNFGGQFPSLANKGDIFVRVDALPNRVYKFDGKRWIEINKENTNTYLHDKEYIKYLIGKISSGEYDTELLSDNEKELIAEYLNSQKS